MSFFKVAVEGISVLEINNYGLFDYALLFSCFFLILGATSHSKTPYEQIYVQSQNSDNNVTCKTYLKPKKTPGYRA